VVPIPEPECIFPELAGWSGVRMRRRPVAGPCTLRRDRLPLVFIPLSQGLLLSGGRFRIFVAQDCQSKCSRGTKSHRILPMHRCFR